MTVNWDGYTPYTLAAQYGAAYARLTRKQARERYNHIMTARPARIGALSKLLLLNGVTLETDDASIQAVDDWIRASIERDPDDSRDMAAVWKGFCFDLALFLGEVMIQRNPTLRWELSTTGPKKAEGYQKHVITGFTKAHDPGYYVNLDRRVETDLYRALAGDTDMPDFLVRTLKMEHEYG